MTHSENPAEAGASVEEIQRGWLELKNRVVQLEIERSALEQESAALRLLLERVIEHRQKSHSELVLLLTGLVSKLPINDIGAIVSRLVEHNTHVGEVCAAFTKGTAEPNLPQPTVLKALDQTKRELLAALKPAVAELIRLETPLETGMLQSLVAQPEQFYSPPVVRANRCFAKGQVPRERIVKGFGEEALTLFNDLTTDPKLNPNPKPEEIMLAFKNDLEALVPQHPTLPPPKREELLALYRRIQRTKLPTEARSQRNAFQSMCFILELLHYYDNQNTEAPDGVFAQRLPALIEQLVVTGPQDDLDEKLIVQAESLIAFVISQDHRLMIINNVGKGSRLGKTLKYVLRFRAEKVSEPAQLAAEFVRHLIPPQPQKPPQPQTLAAVLRLVKPDTQRLIVYAIVDTDRLRREEAEALAKAVGTALGLTGLEVRAKAPEGLPVEMERQRAWEHIKDLIARRSDPAAIAAAMRDRFRARYDADELKQSWITFTEADPMSLIKIFCQLPFLPDGKTDPIARPVMQTYLSRLTHEKYGATYAKVVNSLRTMFKANAKSHTLLNFMELVKWVDAEAAVKLSADIGMAPHH